MCFKCERNVQRVFQMCAKMVMVKFVFLAPSSLLLAQHSDFFALFLALNSAVKAVLVEQQNHFQDMF
jgi:ERCC4-related helicase